jgi:hypothetical protein
VHAPFTHAWLVHDAAFCQAPADEQVCGCWPVHFTCPGAQLPWHAPETQV